MNTSGIHLQPLCVSVMPCGSWAFLLVQYIVSILMYHVCQQRSGPRCMKHQVKLVNKSVSILECFFCQSYWELFVVFS